MVGQRSGVDAWFDRQTHAMTSSARLIRDAILRAVPDAVESIKWEAPNFAVHDDFATFSMRRPGVLQIILHTGAKPKPDLPAIPIVGLESQRRWAGHNRAILTFTSVEDVADALPAFERMIAVWAAHAGVSSS